MAGLVLQARALIFVKLRIDFAFERRPLFAELRRFFRALVVDVVDVLNDGLARVQLVGPWHVVEEEQQIVGRGGGGLEHLRNFGGILAGEAGSGGHAAVHADALGIVAVPLAPAVPLAGFDVRPVVAAGDVGERLRAEEARVVHVGRPRLHEHFVNGRDDVRIVADRLPGPLFGDLAPRSD